MIESPEDEAEFSAGVVPFRCDVSYIEDRAAVLVRGELDLATAPVLLREVLATLALPIRGITVDLGYVTFMDSTGVHALLQARSAAEELGIAFRLPPVPRPVRRVLEVTGLIETFGLATRPDSGLPPTRGGTAA